MLALVIAVAAASLACRAGAHTRSTFSATEFALLGRAPPTSSMTFTAALPMARFDELRAALLDVADPASPRYSQWLAPERVRELMAPPPATRAQVRSWYVG